MPEEPASIRRKSLISFVITLAVFMAGCANIPPSRSVPLEQQPPLFKAPTRGVELPTPQPTEINATLEPTQIANCTNELEYLADLSIPDGTQLNPGTLIEKEWKVKNSGTCNWNNSYTLRLISGSPLGIEATQALIPARSGSEAIIHLEFIAPSEPGKYNAAWQAYGPDGFPFGEWLSIEIAVTTP